MNAQNEKLVPGWLRAISTILSDAAGVVLIAMMTLVVFDIVARSTGFGSIEWVVEISSISVPLIVCFGLATCTAASGHIFIDLFTRRLRPAVNRLIDALWLLVMVLVLAVIAWYSLEEAIGAHGTGERSEVLHWSPLIWAVPAVVGLVLALIVALFMGVRSILALSAPDQTNSSRENSNSG